MEKLISRLGLGFVVWFLTAQFAKAATRLDPAKVRKIVEFVNETEFGGWFSVNDVMAIIQIESSFYPDAKRYEAKLNDASLGLMQILLSTARDRGFSGGPAGLFDPLTNVRLGMAQLKWSYDYLENRLGYPPPVDMWIGSYNAGVGNALKQIWSPGYVQKWQNARAGF